MDISSKTNLFNKITFNLRSWIIDYLDLNEYLKVFCYNKQSQEDIVRYFRLKGKTSKNKAVYYLKYIHLFNERCREYYSNNIYHLLTNADGVYELLTTNHYKNFVLTMRNEIDNEKKQYGLMFNWDMINISKWFNKVVVIQIMFHFNSQSIYELDYSTLKLTQEGIELLLLLIKNTTTIENLDISKSVLRTDDIFAIIKETRDKAGNFTLVLTSIRLTQLHLRLINSIMDEDPQKKYTIDLIYKGMIKQIKEEHSTKK